MLYNFLFLSKDSLEMAKAETAKAKKEEVGIIC
jgi:hypothetical protein